MEIVAMDMKLRGMYIARQLSFHGVTFKIEEVPLSESFRKAYDDSVDLVSSIDIWKSLVASIWILVCYKFGLRSTPQALVILPIFIERCQNTMTAILSNWATTTTNRPMWELYEM